MRHVTCDMWHNYKSSLLSKDIKTKVVQHVPRINISILHMTCAMWYVTFEMRNVTCDIITNTHHVPRINISISHTLKYRIKGAPFIRGQKHFCPASFLFDVRPLYSNSFIFGVFGAPIIFQIIFLEPFRSSFDVVLLKIGGRFKFFYTQNRIGCVFVCLNVVRMSIFLQIDTIIQKLQRYLHKARHRNTPFENCWKFEI